MHSSREAMRWRAGKFCWEHLGIIFDPFLKTLSSVWDSLKLISSFINWETFNWCFYLTGCCGGLLKLLNSYWFVSLVGCIYSEIHKFTYIIERKTSTSSQSHSVQAVHLDTFFLMLCEQYSSSSGNQNYVICVRLTEMPMEDLLVFCKSPLNIIWKSNSWAFIKFAKEMLAFSVYYRCGDIDNVIK